MGERTIEPKNILVVDDDEAMRVALAEALGRGGYSVRTAGDGEEAFRSSQSAPADLIISDVRMPKMTGLQLLQTLRTHSNPVPVVLITAYGSDAEAEEAMRLGATDYVQKPFGIGMLDQILQRAFNPDGETSPSPSLTTAAPPLRPIVTENETMLTTLDIAARVAPSQSSVLIHGESGTGKELIARFIHKHSDRSNGPFIAVNCAALPESLLESELFGHEKGSFTGAIARKIGRFEMAHGGTILLDEVTEMAASLQAKLLRVLQEREIDRVGGKETVPIDIRVIATTNRDIEEAVEEGIFREDLFFRLNVIPLHLPPLRERTGDIEPLVNHFIKKFNGVMGKSVRGMAPEALDLALKRPWKGNIRELENVMERAVLLAQDEKITVADMMLKPLTPPVATVGGVTDDIATPGETVAGMEEKLIMRTLDSLDWNRTRAAEQLGISIRTLRNKLNEYKVKNK